MKALNINIFNVDEFTRTKLLNNQKEIIEPKEFQKIVVNTITGEWNWSNEEDNRAERAYCLEQAAKIITSTGNPEASAEMVITQAKEIYKYLYGVK